MTYKILLHFCETCEEHSCDFGRLEDLSAVGLSWDFCETFTRLSWDFCGTYVNIDEHDVNIAAKHTIYC